jgi:hypothetical protein
MRDEIMICKIYDITGKVATDSESGQIVHDIIISEIKKGQPIDLDFEGVEIFATAFFNFAIGQLLANASVETLDSLVHFQSLSGDGREIVDRVIDHATEYYFDPVYQEAVDVGMEEYAASY